ncbi:RnfH family protein [Kangiella sediminilitoris]|uniref:UPF0125 protein KS2013_548 n=1 Tax=Kangiella sediminilitoris TaxID=1144748 RepID=A0A1B3B900_9GAMM|nr:RnfH family protein [Kangiella sediminilitoris]AOE49272.1 hypothetical protein KS2013_548 [Kangiella sediminilitoris]
MMEQSSDDTVDEQKEKLHVEVAYALPDKQTILQLEIDPNITVREAIHQSGILEQYPEIDLNIQKVGIFSKLAKLDDYLHDGDRIEIYRPLLIDPKEVRKQRAEKAKQESKNKKQ